MIEAKRNFEELFRISAIMLVICSLMTVYCIYTGENPLIMVPIIIILTFSTTEMLILKDG